MAIAISSHLDGDSFAAALKSGIHRVIQNQDELNAINVFPVPDGDTGTNLTLSLGAALPTLNEPGEKHLGTLLAAIADDLLDGSRGNSGAIVAQFFQGLSDSAEEISRFTPHTFARSVELGSEYAHDALSDPREGTILSVIAAFAQSLKAQSIDSSGDHFAPVLLQAFDAAKLALARTPEQLDVLRKAGVVDAGAQGFVDLIEGIVSCVAHGKVVEAPDLTLLADQGLITETAGDEAELEYRFCTECLVSGTDIDRRKLREALSELGDSLVLAGTKRKAKIHVHVNDPEDVFETARAYGEVSGEKADDMHRQQHSTHHIAAAKFAVITDSAADIPEEEMERLDIHMVPLRLQFGNRGYLDKVGITPAEFFHELRTNPDHPTTSQPSAGDFRRSYQFLASHFPDVISVNLTGRVSGTLQAAESAAARTNASGRVHVVNSRNASLGQGLLTVLAAECAEAGLDAQTTLEVLEAAIPQTISFGLVKDLTYAVRGGRVPASRKLLADLLRVTPVLRTTPEGNVSSAGILPGRRNSLYRFARYVARHSPEGEVRIAIGHAECPADAERLAKLLEKRLPTIASSSMTTLGAALGVHAGPGALVVGVQRLIRPEEFVERRR